MKKISLTGSLLMTSMSLLSQQFKLPHLGKKGTAVQLIVKDKPFLALAHQRFCNEGYTRRDVALSKECNEQL